MSRLIRGLNTIHVIGAGPEDAIGRVLREAFNKSVFFPDKALPTAKSDLIVGVSMRCESGDLLSLTKWAHDADIPAFRVEIKHDIVLIGPLTLSNRAGCGQCSFERMTAALAGFQVDAEALSIDLDESAQRIAPLVVGQIRAIIEKGPELSELLDHVLVVDIETLDESLHKVIPLSDCEVCGGAEAFPTTTQSAVELSSQTALEDVLEALAGWVDRRTGVISNLFIEPPNELEVSLPIVATAAPPHVMEKDGSLRRLPIGWGKGLTISGAVISAVGEAVERYSASLVDRGRIVWKRPHELDGEFLDPRASGLYSDQQYARDDFPYVRFDTEIPHPWVLGCWSATRKPVWVPAINVFLSIELQQEQLICQGTSNGLAASTNEADASLRAILELVERDAFMTAWLTAARGRRIELDDTLDPLLRTVLEGIEAFGAMVELYDLPTSIIGTTVLCLALGNGNEYPGVTFGLGCDLEPRAALRQAVLELGQTGPYLRRMMRTKRLTAPSSPSSVREMLDHASYYFPAERAAAFDRLRSKDSSITLRELGAFTERSYENCVAALKDAEVRVALVDVTSADVATGPFRVIRAVSPDLQPIWYGYGLERTPVERIRRLGVAADTPPINPIW